MDSLHIGEHFTKQLFGLDFHIDTIITMWFAMGIVLALSFWATSKVKLVPGKLQAVFENIVIMFLGLTKDMGKDGPRHAVLLMSLFLFILTANLVGQLPWGLFHLPKGEFAAPTNDLNLTVALAVSVLLYYIGSGVALKGISYFKHYFQPSWLMAPLNIMEDFIRPLTLSLRLFANILAGEVLVMVLGGLILIVLTPEGAMGFVLKTIGSVLMLIGLIKALIAKKGTVEYERKKTLGWLILAGGFIMTLAFTQDILSAILPQGLVYNIGLFLGSLLPLPIMFFELFVATIQALVFTLLTSAYITLATAQDH
jgi:F-type H+-transporting ATPase subunit a